MTDTLGAGLTFGAVTSAGLSTCNAANPLVCTLPAGTVPGTYVVTYTATVNGTASGTVNNAVVSSGAIAAACSADCALETPVALPVITVVKSSNPPPGTEMQVGQTIEYTLTATVDDAATLADVVLVDTPNRGLTLGALPSGCVMSGATVTCTVPARSPVGVYRFVYTATINADAVGSVGNQVAATTASGPAPI
ncbi:hypothetical protein, partial [Lysobacter antibioticus]|uniref:hypothetical protein n=1 Tax=Lysobacter antibioticus TaxID=84531 RepID=UPI00126A53C8